MSQNLAFIYLSLSNPFFLPSSNFCGGMYFLHLYSSYSLCHFFTRLLSIHTLVHFVGLSCLSLILCIYPWYICFLPFQDPKMNYNMDVKLTWTIYQTTHNPRGISFRRSRTMHS
ncbi:hypothetical protein F5890DRAFT_358323 [Lentinula detonsa]|uniref:Uncharacterized protein n=1 Tax=Lentinula detonsa TaxID=2804962 RepID=A0AA38Q6Z4_9AGAR|nr:hypothetical protein F5890DRAFT_358323 [Lentinula detonsa]